VSKAAKNGVKSTLVCDVQVLELPPSLSSEKPFDAAFSNAALHWCKRNPAGVLEGLKRVLKPGGRFACEMGGFMNCIGEEHLPVVSRANMFRRLQASESHYTTL